MEEQKERMRSFFSKEFGLEVEAFLSLDEISSGWRYFENLDYIKEILNEIFNENREDFRDRMYKDDLRRLEEWFQSNS